MPVGVEVVLSMDSLAEADREAGGQEVWADGSRRVGCPAASWWSGLLDLEGALLCSREMLMSLSRSTCSLSVFSLSGSPGVSPLVVSPGVTPRR